MIVLVPCNIPYNLFHRKTRSVNFLQVPTGFRVQNSYIHSSFRSEDPGENISQYPLHSGPRNMDRGIQVAVR